MEGKKKEEASGGAPAWMVTYGDMVTLLLTFFVLLLSFSSIQESKFREAIGSLKGSLGLLTGQNKVVVQSYIPPIKVSAVQKKSEIQDMIHALQDFIERERLEDKVKLEFKDDGLNIVISDPVLFSLGKADLKPTSFPLIKRIAGVLSNFDSEIHIKGHTCDLPIHNLEFESNWELSAARALEVVKVLIDSNISPEKLSAVAYSQYRPTNPNDLEDNRRKNRRVEIFVPEEDFDELMRATIPKNMTEDPGKNPVAEVGYE